MSGSSRNPHTYRIDRRIPGVGRLAVASGASTKDGLRRRNTLITRLIDRGRLDILRAVKSGQLTLTEVLDADNRDAFDSLLQEAKPLDRPLWERVDAWTNGSTRPQRERGRHSFARLRELTPSLKDGGTLGEKARVRDLERVNWIALEERWTKSASSWNHLRKAVSKFLTDELGDRWHDFRRRLITTERFPLRREVERVPDLSVELFWTVVLNAPRHVQPAYVLLAHTGIDVGPYLRLTTAHLKPNTFTIDVPDTKTAYRQDVVRVDERMWDWIERAVPAPVQYKSLRTHWKRALAAADADTTLRLKDLRHCAAQWAVNEGVQESKVQVALRHSNLRTTRRYTKQRDKGEVAAAIADAMLRSA